MAVMFEPLQYGVNTRGGCEMIVHAINAHLQKHPEHVLMSIDCKNAFNCVSRAAFMRKLAASPLRGLLPFVAQFYVDTPSLFFRRDTGESVVLDSLSGPQQGDPFGPFLFSLAIHDIITDISTRFPRVKLLAYLDDIFLLGDAKDVAEAFEALTTALSTVNLECCNDKCKVYSPAGADALGPLAAPALKLKVKDGSIVVLGVPIGATAEACMLDAVTSLDPELFPRSLAKKLAGLELLVKHKRHYTALLLLSVCAAPSVTHLLRAQPPRITLPAAREADAMLRTAFLRALHIAISEVPAGSFRERLIHLQVKSGGLGIQSAEDAAGRAFFASWAACGAAIAARCPHLAADIAAVFAPPPAAPPPAPPPSDDDDEPPPPPAPPPTLPFQRDLQDQRSKLSADLALDLSYITLKEPEHDMQRKLGELAAVQSRAALDADVRGYASGRPDERQTLAWWLSGSELGRSAFLRCFALWKPLPLRALAMAVRRLLRLPLPELRDCTHCTCGAAVDAFGDHADACYLLAGWRSGRHDKLRDDAVLAPCKQVGIRAYRETPGLVSGTKDRPADAWLLGLELEAEPTLSEVCADVMVVASITQHLKHGEDIRPGASLLAGFSRKLGNVQKLASDRMILLPLVASSMGGFHSAWLHLYESLAMHWQQRGEGRDGDKEKEALTDRWMAEASTSLQYSQCSVILALVNQCARVDPVTGAEPRSWQPLQFEEVLPYLPGGAR
jgi:hypothetical protein